MHCQIHSLILKISIKVDNSLIFGRFLSVEGSDLLQYKKSMVAILIPLSLSLSLSHIYIYIYIYAALHFRTRHEGERAENQAVIDREILEVIDRFKYLGSVVTAAGQAEKDINGCIGNDQLAFGRLRPRLATKIPLYHTFVCLETRPMRTRNFRKQKGF